MTAVAQLPRRGSTTARARTEAFLVAAGLATAPNGRPAGQTSQQAADARRAAAERRRAAVRAVPDRRKDPFRLAAPLVAALAVTIVVLGVLGVVALNALAAEASFEARALEQEISDLTLHHDDLVAAVAQLESPNRVRDVALGQLGLMEPEVPGFLEIDPADMPAPQPKPMVRTGS
ncbi:hypothetical protein DVS28_a2960 [Euzebya pacifica]|uniref:Cell division protein FtsL n=1 Tax=Euzebya pacifica TaxID=1608957 RepID=A0A346XZJ2_9ACTN|nr:hypothetical protein [Euzebya pacifica]AXV07639.1 hypothetical protein DVS28_a2960 [Euzebya pacifica]